MTSITMKLLREPLVQFLCLGVLIFAVDRYVLVTSDDPRRILIDDRRYAELVDIFEEGQSRLPTEEEIQELMVKWAQNEVLYREARSMGLDLGDEMIRQRLILKIRDILFNNLIIELPEDDELRAWFEDNRIAYDRPELLDFEQFLLGDADQARAGRLAAELGSSSRPEEFVDSFRAYGRRPRANLESVFGESGAERLATAAESAWVPVQSDYGTHLARITARYPGEPAVYEVVRAQVAQDWKDAQRKRELSMALSAIVDQYDISYSLSPDVVRESLAAAQTAARTRAQ